MKAKRRPVRKLAAFEKRGWAIVDGDGAFVPNGIGGIKGSFRSRKHLAVFLEPGQRIVRVTTTIVEINRGAR